MLSFSLIILSFTLGLRHGIDYDHIAAITDLTGGTQGEKASVKDLIPATLYALGHALVVVVLGLLALWVGTILPDWVDSVMERVVGITMLALAAWLLHNLWHHIVDGKPIQMKSRWMLILDGVNHTLDHLLHREHHHHNNTDKSMHRTAFGVGMLHGIGAETGSQALLLASIAGASTTQIASVVLGVFVFGLLLSNTLVAILAVFSFNVGKRNSVLPIVVAGIAMVFSLVIGLVFITGNASVLPALL